MPLHEVARKVANTFGLELSEVEDRGRISGFLLQGQGFRIYIESYFGGWQSVVEREGKKARIFAEDTLGLLAQLRSYGLQVREGSIPKEIPPR